MQTVWSRIAQTRISCHCPSCASVAHGVARRTTTTAGRRPVKMAVSSTFVYSTIFAAAATTDAGLKQKRRDQWDRAIADIKQDLDQPAGEETTQAENEGHVRYKPITEEPLEALLEAVRTPLRDPIWPTNTGVPLVKANLPPQSVYADEQRRKKTLDSRWTPKKLRMTELSVDKLILRLLLDLESEYMRPQLESAVPESCHSFFFAPKADLKALLMYTNSQHLVASRLDSYAGPDQLPRRHRYGVSYIQDEHGNFHRTAAQLDIAFRQLFKKRKSGQLTHPELIAKICYNLSISTAAPSLDCWNTLLAGLLENDQDASAIPPIINAIKNSNMRLNEITMKSILKFYIDTNDLQRFGGFIDKMRGFSGGLSLARPDITINEVGRSRLVQDEKTGKIVQKPYPTPGVFEVLIHGVLNFVGFDGALRVCQDMGSHGWGLSIRGLTPLLDDRAVNADWDAGCQLWDQIKRLQAESRYKGRPERLFPQTYSAMLRLCNMCGQTARFDEILREALGVKYPHRTMLDLFKKESQPRQRRNIKISGSWRKVESSVTDEGLEKVVSRIYGDATGVVKPRAEEQPAEEETKLEVEDETPEVYEVDTLVTVGHAA